MVQVSVSMKRYNISMVLLTILIRLLPYEFVVNSYV